MSCSNEDKLEQKTMNCPGKPLQGIVKLKIEKTLTIDSLSIDNEKPPLFEFLVKDENEGIYIGSNRPEIRVYKFSPGGIFLGQFLRKGEGPGELNAIHSLQYIDNTIIVSSDTKTAKYDLDGKYISEKRFKKIYSNITFIDQEHFIANYFKIDEKNKNMWRICSIINLSSESVKADLFKSARENIGYTNIKDNDGKIRFTVALFGITPDYRSVYNMTADSIIQCLTDDGRIYIKNQKGDLKKTIDCKFKNWRLTENDKNDVMASFTAFPEDLKNMVRKNLPGKMLAISSIKLLPKGYFAVYYNKNFAAREIRIFDKAGIFRYVVLFPEESSDRPVIFTKNGLAKVEWKEERDLYIEYRITNLAGVFD